MHGNFKNVQKFSFSHDIPKLVLVCSDLVYLFIFFIKDCFDTDLIKFNGTYCGEIIKYHNNVVIAVFKSDRKSQFFLISCDRTVIFLFSFYK